MRVSKDIFFEKTASFEDIPLHQAKGMFSVKTSSENKIVF